MGEDAVIQLLEALGLKGVYLFMAALALSALIVVCSLVIGRHGLSPGKHKPDSSQAAGPTTPRS